jgi:hypothetical protein
LNDGFEVSVANRSENLDEVLRVFVEASRRQNKWSGGEKQSSLPSSNSSSDIFSGLFGSPYVNSLFDEVCILSVAYPLCVFLCKN